MRLVLVMEEGIGWIPGGSRRRQFVLNEKTAEYGKWREARERLRSVIAARSESRGIKQIVPGVKDIFVRRQWRLAILNCLEEVHGVKESQEVNFHR